MAAVLGRYARAFAEVAMEHKLDPDKTVEELGEVAALVEGNRELRNVLQNPAVAHGQKLALLDALMQRMGGGKLLRNFLAVLIDHHRIASLGEIVTQFKEELDRRMGIAEARVSSARALSPAEKKSLENQLAEITGMTVRATYSEDAALLGGVMVRVGSTIYDGSVHGRLQRMRQEIASS
ncbi:MAG TPA: ATP synthase F1 subunit delta [Candidatus Angelobacter sp.]|nr:ATP synthase F1 subunit delta [Candidatus Angelobacter sp.]